MLKSRTDGVLALFSEVIFCLPVGFLCQVSLNATAERLLFVDMRERQDGGLCRDEGSSGREF